MGLDVFVAALSMVARQGRDFIAYIAGDGPEQRALMKQVAEGHLSGRVIFLGKISDETARLAYAAADLFVLPTRSLECFGIIILEALAHGCPVIGSTAGAIPEILGPLSPDLLFERSSPEGLAAKMRAFLDEELPIPSASVLARYVEEHYSKPMIARRYLDALSVTQA